MAVRKAAGGISAIGAWDWEPMLAARHFRRHLGLERIMDSFVAKNGRDPQLTDRALALVTNRLCDPTSGWVITPLAVVMAFAGIPADHHHTRNIAGGSCQRQQKSYTSILMGPQETDFVAVEVHERRTYVPLAAIDYGLKCPQYSGRSRARSFL